MNGSAGLAAALWFSRPPHLPQPCSISTTARSSTVISTTSTTSSPASPDISSRRMCAGGRSALPTVSRGAAASRKLLPAPRNGSTSRATTWARSTPRPQSRPDGKPPTPSCERSPERSIAEFGRCAQQNPICDPLYAMQVRQPACQGGSDFDLRNQCPEVPMSACKPACDGCPLGCPPRSLITVVRVSNALASTAAVQGRLLPAKSPGPHSGHPADGWSAGLAQRGLDLLPHDPGQLVPGDQQLLAGGLLPEPLQDPSADQHARKLPARLGEPPQRGQRIRGDAHAVDLRPATRRPAVRDEPRRVIRGSPPLKLLPGLRDDLLLSLPGHRLALPSTLPAT